MGAFKSWSVKLALALGSPCLFLLLVEVGLRLGGVGHATDFFIPDERPGFYRTNPRFTELVFPASFGLKPLNFRLSREKPAGSVRVFVIGESAAMGVPEPGFSIAPQLGAQLRAAQPGKSIEVYNLGVTAINSHTILPIVRQAVTFQPDLLVIYMGNNEVVGPFGSGSAVTGTMPPLAWIRASMWTRRWRTGQLIQRTLERLRPQGGGRGEWRGMEMFVGKTVAADDPRLQKVYANFAANLDEILGIAREAGVPTVLSTVAVNVRESAPFASLHRADLPGDEVDRWRAIISGAERASERGDSALAAGLYAQALGIDPGHADTHFRLARVLEASGEFDRARQHFHAALQHDALRFRADARINAIIRRAAKAQPRSVTLADAALDMGSDANSISEPAGSEAFLEHVHLTWEGNHALARLLAGRAAPVLFGAVDGERAWLGAAACADALGFTAFGRAAMLKQMETLTGRPPFTGQSSFARDRTRLTLQIAATEDALATPADREAAAAVIDRALAKDPANAFLLFHLASIRLELGEASRALALNEQLAAVLPASSEQAAQRAFILHRLGRTGEAIDILLAAARAEPYYFQTYTLLGRLWAESGQGTNALEYFSDLTSRMAESLAARHTYAALLATGGDMTAAEAQWRAILERTPDDEAALEPLLARMWERRAFEPAIELMRRAHAYNPRSFSNNARLVEVAQQRGETVQAAAYMSDLAASGPVSAELHLDRAELLFQLNQPDEGVRALHRARAAAVAESDDALVQRIDGLFRKHSGGAR